MKTFYKFIQFIYCIYFLIWFVGILLIIFPLVIIASFFGKIHGGNFIYWLCQRWADVVLFVSAINIIKIGEEKVNPNQPYVYVFNHISYLDIPIIMKAMCKQHFRVLGKAEMSKIPIFGFLYKQAVVSVERSNSASRAKSVMQLKSILQKKISIVVSPEGTFNMTNKPLKEFFDGAFKVAIETQTPIKPVLFLDAYDRMGYERLFSLTPGKCRVVYMDDVSVTNYSLTDTQKIKQQVYSIMEKELIAYNASWIKE